MAADDEGPRQLRAGVLLVRETEDPDGGAKPVIERIDDRYIDVLHFFGVLTKDQHLGAKKLRDNWDQGGRLVADMRAAAEAKSRGQLTDDALDCAERHKRAMRALGLQKARIIEAVVLHEETIESVGGRIKGPLALLERALNALADYCAAGRLDEKID